MRIIEDMILKESVDDIFVKIWKQHGFHKVVFGGMNTMPKKPYAKPMARGDDDGYMDIDEIDDIVNRLEEDCERLG